MRKYPLIQKFLYLILLSIISFSASASNDLYKLERDLEKMPSGEYELDKEVSSLTWRVNHFGLSNYTARFAQIDATIYLNPSQLHKSKVMAVISPVSITTDYPFKREKDFDHELSYGEKWFNVEKYHTMKFRSTKITITGSNTGKLEGVLSMLGKTKPVTLNVKFNRAIIKHPIHEKPVIGFSATGTLNRSDWGMDNLIPDISDEVEIIIESQFVKKRV